MRKILAPLGISIIVYFDKMEGIEMRSMRDGTCFWTALESLY